VWEEGRRRHYLPHPQIDGTVIGFTGAIGKMLDARLAP
jgi:hypothetical protein